MQRNLFIIDYGSGNLRSAAKAFERVAADTGHRVRVSSDSADLETASHIVLPGVGAFADCMHGLKSIPGMLETLHRQVHEKQTPFLGICVGMQMLFDTGYEHGEHRGLGWLTGTVGKIVLPASAFALKIPHMGWNELHLTQPQHPLLHGISSGEHVYFVHSYHVKCEDNATVIATTEHGIALTAVVARGNIMGTQFHPEKSQETGLKLLRNFLQIT